MHDNPMFTGAQDQLERGHARDRRAGEAFGLLRQEFLETLMRDPHARISTPGLATDTQPLVDLVAQMLVGENGLPTLALLLSMLCDSFNGEMLMARLADTYAHEQVELLAAHGAFDE
jgi:hypothetical protein